MLAENLNSIKVKGWVILENIVEKELINELKINIDKAYEVCRSIQISNGIEANTDGTVHHLLAFKGCFLDFLSKSYCHDILLKYFDSPYILNTYGGVINLPGKASYVANIHRDIRTFYNIPMMMNMLVMLDDFTLENGATYLLTGSHLKNDKPDSEDFYLNADRATARAGSILLFDSLLWHSAGINKTANARRALTLAFTRPFQKQQLDYPRLLGYDEMDSFDENLKQVLGYNSRVPTSLNEWYQPPDKRFYKPGQG
jgi:ectoine hydroxylase-related dioxygenase (phytanoyl-CoA dioxygenase family)